MADRGKIVEILHKLKVGAIDPGWVKETWDGDFGEYDGLPTDLEEDYLENHYHVRHLKDAQAELLPWAQGEETRQGEGLWSVLVEEDLPYKNLVALLFGIMETAQKRIANVSQKEAGVLSAAIYFTILQVPGSGAFKIFHPMLFEKAVKMFKIWSQLEGGVPKRKRASISPPRPSQSQRSKSRRKNKADTPARDEEDPFAGDEEEEEEIGLLSSAEIGKLQKALMHLLKVYVGFLSTFSLRDCEQSAFTALQTLAELSKLEAETFSGNFDEDLDISQMRSVPQLAFKGLEILCSDMHGEQVSMVTLVFKQLLPSLLMYVGNNKGVAASTIPRNILNIKDQALNFVLHLADKLPQEGIMPALRILLQHMCAKVPDKSDYRAKMAQSIVILLQSMSATTCARMTEWIYKYSRNAKISWRGFALDIVGLLMLKPERNDVDVPEELKVFLSHHFLLQVLLARCSDVAPTVRSRAITMFGQCMASDESSVSAVVRDIMTPHIAGGRRPMTRIIPTPDRSAPGTAEQDTPAETTDRTDATDNIEMTDANGLGPSTIQSPFMKILSRLSLGTPGGSENGTPHTSMTSAMMTIQLTPGLEITLSDGKGVTSMLRRRAADEKVNVRKSALHALEGIVNLNDDFNKQDLDIIEERCRDPALSVRKQALSCLTSLLHGKPHHALIQRAWLSGVLPMVMDRESTAQEKCLETLEDIILNNIVKKERSTETCHEMAWALLKTMASSGQVELRRFLQKASQHWGKSGHLKSSLTTALKSHINTDNNDGAWMLLAEMASFAPKFDTDFIVEYWEQHARNAPESENNTVEKVLTVLSHVAKNIPPEKCGLLADDMKQRLMLFNSAPELTAATVNALNKLCLSQSEDKHAVKKLTDQWFGELLKACDHYLSSIILNQNQDTPLDEDRIIRHLFTLGEMAQLCPTQTPKRVFMLVQSLIAAPVISADMSSNSIASTTSSNPHESGSSSETAAGPEVLLASGSSQGSQPLSQLSQDVLSQFRGSKMSGRVRAHAFLTLGKLCLQNQDLAKKCVAALARELEVSTDPTVRNNIVVIMADLCIRYTTLVDRYVPNISSCLKDNSPLIRKQCLTLLTRLLQEDFLKWKGSLFYHFVITLVDDVREISDFAEFCMVHLLMQRHPAMFYQHFIECIFFFNGYDKHAMYNKFSQTDRERKLFSLRGKENSEKRLRIYQFLLEHMTDEHRFLLTAKLCQEILAGLVDGAMTLDADTMPLLQDALSILTCKEIKLSTMRTKPQDDIAETEQEMAAVVMNAAKKTLITQVVKKNVIENIVPVVISLKHMLEKQRSPALKDLMIFMMELMKDYKTEVKDVMSADPQLAKEIEYDLRRFEEQQQQEEQQRLAQPRVEGRPLLTPDALRPQVTPGRPGAPQTPRLVPNRLNTPQRSGTPKVQGTPRIAGTPQVPGTPAARMHTPARPLPMSTMAVINSARKAMEILKETEGMSSPGSSQSDDGTANQGKKVGFKNATPPVTVDPPKIDQYKTPDRQRTRTPRKKILRAISTPSANLTLSNITFHQDMNLSMIPASPSSATNSVFSQEPSTPGWTRRLVDDIDGGQKEQFIINMMSPDKPAPKPRTWNIKSPSSSKAAKKTNSENVSPDPLREEAEMVTNQRPPRQTSKDRSKTKKDLSAKDDSVDDTTLTQRSTRSKQRKKTPKVALNDSSGENSDKTPRRSNRSRNK